MLRKKNQDLCYIRLFRGRCLTLQRHSGPQVTNSETSFQRFRSGPQLYENKKKLSERKKERTFGYISTGVLRYM